MPQPRHNLYDIVGVAPDAPAEEVARACDARRAELEARGSADSGAIALVRHAREVLTDPAKRAAYDARLAAIAASATPATGAANAAAPGTPTADAPAGVMPEPAAAGEAPTPARQPPWGLIAVFGAAALIVVLFVARMMTNPVPEPVAEAPKAPAAPPAPPPTPLTPSQVIAAASPSIARLQALDLSGNVLALGLAVVTDPGIAATTCHAIPANAQIVAMFGAEKAAATLVITDEVLDLCKLSLAGVDAKPLALAPDAPAAGDAVLVVSPDAPGSYALAEATVHEPARDGVPLKISTNAANGAPVLDAAGRLIGIATTGHVIPAGWIAQARSRTR
jgi:hypothetical protein